MDKRKITRGAVDTRSATACLATGPGDGCFSGLHQPPAGTAVEPELLATPFKRGYSHDGFLEATRA